MAELPARNVAHAGHNGVTTRTNEHECQVRIVGKLEHFYVSHALVGAAVGA